MKYVLQPGEIIKNKFDIETKLQYLSEAGYKGKGMRYINVLCASCNTEHIKQFASIRAGYITSCVAMLYLFNIRKIIKLS